MDPAALRTFQKTESPIYFGSASIHSHGGSFAFRFSELPASSIASNPTAFKRFDLPDGNGKARIAFRHQSWSRKEFSQQSSNDALRTSAMRLFVQGDEVECHSHGSPRIAAGARFKCQGGGAALAHFHMAYFHSHRFLSRLNHAVADELMVCRILCIRNTPHG